LVYESAKSGPGGGVSVLLTPIQLLDRLAALIPPLRRHRHRYIGVLAPNSPLRAAVTALTQSAEEIAPAVAEPAPLTDSQPAEKADEPLHRKAARYAAAHPHLRGTAPVVPQLRWRNADHRVHHQGGGDPRDSRPSGRADSAAASAAGARTAAVGEVQRGARRNRTTGAQPAPDYEFDQRIAW